jgi:DNA modification methylase
MNEPFLSSAKSVHGKTLPLNQIVCGDALEVLRTFPDNSIDLVVTDPPFKVSQMYGGGVDADNLINVSSILQVFPEVSRVLKENRFLVTFYDNRILPFLFHSVRGTDLVYRKSIYLYRKWGNANRWLGWMQCTDPICFFVKGHDEPFRPSELKGKVRHDTYVKAHPEAITTGHPAQKPLELLRDIIAWCSEKGDIVLDPYVGSGITCIASKQLHRNFIGIDISPEFCALSESMLTKCFFNEQKAKQFRLFEASASE